MFQMKPGKEKKGKDEGRKIRDMAAALRTENHSEIPADVMGSYTGTPYDGGTPTQDADDL